jgi:hypothetical protein
MGLCLEVNYKLPAVGERQGLIAFAGQVPTKVVEAVRLGAFASPDSPFDLHNVGVFPLIKNNPG